MPVINTTQTFVGRDIHTGTNPYSLYLVAAFGVSNGTNGTSNPRWRDQVMAGVDATTPFSGTLDQITIKPCLLNTTSNVIGQPTQKYMYSGQAWAAGRLTPVPDTSLPSSPQTDNLFLSRVREQRTLFEGSTFIGELADTIRLFKRPLRSIRDLLKRQADAKRRHRRLEGREYARAIAGTWLETSFGILPLVADAGRLRNAMQKFTDKPCMVRVNARRVWKEPLSVSSSTSGGDNPTILLRYLRRDTVQYTYEVRGAVRADPLPFEYWGFDPASMVLAAWEVIPFSFLIDYILPVGTALEAASVRPTSLGWCNRTRRAQGVIRVDQTIVSLTPTYTLDLRYRLGRAARVRKQFDRATYFPKVQLPALRLAPTFNQLINTIALIVSGVNRR